MQSYNKGEWSELYAFFRLLRDGRIYAADENACRIDDIYLPIIKIIREETEGCRMEYSPGDVIRIYSNGNFVRDLPVAELEEKLQGMFPRIFQGAGEGQSGSFPIPEIEPLMDQMHVTKVKASSTSKEDIIMQVHDIATGYSPEVGFSIKSDVGSAPTLLNPGKNTRIRYRIHGLSDNDMQHVNSIDKDVCREYMKERMAALLERSDSIEYDGYHSNTYEDNLIMIDSWLPRIYAEMVLMHYRKIGDGVYNCDELIGLVADENPLAYRNTNTYRYKLKKMVCAAALGMTPGSIWDGTDAATGGYIIIKRDGDVLCYHLYNRNFFEEYLLTNTRLDRPSASRYDYGYVYTDGGRKYIDLNVQIRFKTIGS